MSSRPKSMARALQSPCWHRIPSQQSSKDVIADSLSTRLPALSRNPSPFPSSKVSDSAARQNANTQEWLRLKEQFKSARERCINDPMEGVPFTLEEFLAAIEKPEIGNQIDGTVFKTDASGAFVDFTGNCSGYLALEEACIYKIKHVKEAGIIQGFQEDFAIIGKNEDDGNFILSLKAIQYSLAWERCRQLQEEDAVVIGKIIERKKGGMVTLVEGIRGFLPFSQMPQSWTPENSIGKEILLKILEVNEERFRLLLRNLESNKFTPGAIVSGKVETVKPYGAIINVSGLIGLLHISQISHHHVSDVSAIFNRGDDVKCMVLSYDRGKDRLSLSTKKLESVPGEMLQNPKQVYDQAEQRAQVFLKRIVEAEEVARIEV